MSERNSEYPELSDKYKKVRHETETVYTKLKAGEDLDNILPLLNPSETKE